MSKADKMFKQLRYKSMQNEEIIWFQRRLNKTIVKDIVFCLKSKEVSVEISFFSKEGTLRKTESTITMQELEAINEKCKELGWR